MSIILCTYTYCSGRECIAVALHSKIINHLKQSIYAYNPQRR